MLPSNSVHQCHTSDAEGCPPTTFHTVAFYVSLHLVAFAQSGHKSCVQAFGADQFDQNDAKEAQAKSSFFNRWYFGMCSSTSVAYLLISYIQDNISWALGFGIPCAFMVLTLFIFLSGTVTYRYYTLQAKNPFIKISKSLSRMIMEGWCSGKRGTTARSVIDEPKFVDGSCSSSSITIAEEDEEAKGVLRLFPIWAMCLTFAVCWSQSSTFFTKQGATMDRRISPNFLIPPAGLQAFIGSGIIAFIPMYDRVLVPVARKLTWNPSGITMLQRIGIGMAFSSISMVIAALVEIKRLQVARESGLLDSPEVPLPMSLWWLAPQYLLFSISDTFTVVGLQEFFYDQVPDALRSLGIALYLNIFGIGSIISAFLISVIDKVTGGSRGGAGWFANNINRGYIDYFYWLLAGINTAWIAFFVYFARRYVYKKKACSFM